MEMLSAIATWGLVVFTMIGPGLIADRLTKTENDDDEV
jgi:hypothetical protein